MHSCMLQNKELEEEKVINDSKSKENEVMNVHGTNLAVKEYKGYRVVTFKDIDTVHDRAEGTANKKFLDNKKKVC